MFDIPETLIIALTTLLLVLWTRHWLVQHRGGAHTGPGKLKK
jgi:hypothetical protein